MHRGDTRRSSWALYFRNKSGRLIDTTQLGNEDIGDGRSATGVSVHKPGVAGAIHAHEPESLSNDVYDNAKIGDRDVYCVA